VRAEDLFHSLYETVVGPIERPFRILGVDCDKGDARGVYENAPTGLQSESGLVRTVGYSADRATVTEAIARLVRVYSRRVDAKTAAVRPPSDDWVAGLRQDFPRRFDCTIECGAGWADLIRAMAEWLEEIDLPSRWRFWQIKEKFASMRAYSSGIGLSAEQVNLVRERVDACEAISLFLCERCGEVGKPRRKTASSTRPAIATPDF
jgi:hypothetical protein